MWWVTATGTWGMAKFWLYPRFKKVNVAALNPNARNTLPVQ